MKITAEVAAVLVREFSNTLLDMSTRANATGILTATHAPGTPCPLAIAVTTNQELIPKLLEWLKTQELGPLARSTRPDEDPREAGDPPEHPRL